MRVFAGEISAPPPLPEESAAEQHYFYELYSNWQRLEETTTNPNENRIGNIGDMVLYKDTLLRYFFTINIDGQYHWQAVELKDIL